VDAVGFSDEVLLLALVNGALAFASLVALGLLHRAISGRFRLGAADVGIVTLFAALFAAPT